MQKPRRGSAYWIAPRGLFSLLPYTTQDYQPKDGTTHNGSGPPHQSVIKKMPQDLPTPLSYVIIFLMGVLSPPVTLACLDDIKLARTTDIVSIVFFWMLP